MKANCLTRALDQWNEDREGYRLWYNSDHVIALQSEYEGSDLSMMRTSVMDYLPLKDYGFDYFVSAFELYLRKKHHNLLVAYFKQEESE